MFADLAVDTAVTPDAQIAGRYHLALPDHWDYLMPSGGVIMTCALRAAEAHLADPSQRLASATTIFASPVPSGPLVADVHVIRRGSGASQLRVALRHQLARDPGPQLELVVTFCRERKGPDVIGTAFPAVPHNPHTRWRFYHQLDSKLAEGEAFWTHDFAAGPARYARWLRYKVPQRDRDGRLDRLALPPLVDTMPTALHRALGPGGYRFHAPSLDLTLYTVDDTEREWLLVSVVTRRARAGWAIADAEVWDEDGRFVAYAAQAMYIQSVAGEPPIIDASERR
jgi:acyl-CoA thioesterase